MKALRMARARGTNVPGALGITSTTIGAGTQGILYAGFTVSATGGVPPYAYSVQSGALPAGLSLNSATGVVSGTPTSSGTSSTIVIRVMDALGQTADLGGFTITVAESGSGAKAIASTTVSIGEWTRAGRGHVPLSNIMVPTGNEVPVSWAIGSATTGTDGHWTKISAGTTEASGGASTPYPSSAGDAAELSSGLYVFPVTATYADASTDTKSLTISIVANAASMGHYDSFDKASIIGASTSIAAWEAQSTSQKSLLISTGVNHSGVRNGGVADFTFAGPTKVRIRHADPARPSVFSTWECGVFGNPNAYCQFEGIVLTGNVNGLGSTGLWHCQGMSNCDFNDCGANYGSQSNVSASLGALQLFGTNTDLTFNRFEALWVENGLKDLPSAVNTRITFNQCTFRYFFDNAVFISNGVDWVFNDLVTASPMRRQLPDGSGGGSHVDHFQIQDDLGTERVVNLTINRYLCIDADGDAYSGGLFGLRGTYTVNGYCYLGRSNQAMTLNGIEGGANTFKNYTLIKGYGQTFASYTPALIDDTAVKVGDPDMRFYGTDGTGAAWSSGTVAFSSGIVQDSISYEHSGSKPTSMTIASSVHVLGIGTQTSPSSLWNPYFNSDPRDIYDAISTASWAAKDRTALLATAKTVATPKTGITDGAFASTGAWNT
jgi:hypothetical protein